MKRRRDGAPFAAQDMIRTFQNSDVPALSRVWNDHWSLIGPSPEVSPGQFEQAVLSRTFFDSRHLLLSETDDKDLSAWCQSLRDESDPENALLTICMRQGMEEAGVELMSQMLGTLEAEGVRRVTVGPQQDTHFGFAGLAPIGHGIGVPDGDTRVGELLRKSGFTPNEPVVRMIVMTDGYRPPVSREALQLRRTTTTDCETRPPSEPRRASALSHLDIEHHRLLDRSGTPLAETELWVSDAAAAVMNVHHAILDLDATLKDGKLDPSGSYLLAALLQSLGQGHVSSVETVIDADQSELLGQLQALLFQPCEQGRVWQAIVG